jgi:beta-N-acetylhexosaminidase
MRQPGRRIRDVVVPVRALASGSPDPLERLMLAFHGTTVPSWLRTRLADAPVAGFTLFRAPNLRSPSQVRRLTSELQAVAGERTREAAGKDLPLLLATDQEGGQLNALGEGFTQFAGPMAIGATGDEDLAERVGRAIGTELRAVGVNVNYAPVADVATQPANPALGIRSFGDEPAAVARLAAAWLRGLQSAGVAGTAKHFPGKGEGSVDTHLALDSVERSRDELDAVELVPFRALIDAGVRMVMSGHFAVPAVTGNAALPSTLSRRLMHDLLREELGFDGVSITDALDMAALPQDATQAIDVVAALEAGVDLLLSTPDRRAQQRIESALRRAAAVELLDPEPMAASVARVRALRGWLGGFDDPLLEVVGSAEHRALAGELARRSLTLVRDDAGIIPLRPAADARIGAVMPSPRDLTPADTSSSVTPSLAAALRRHHPTVEEVVTAHPPSAVEIAALRDRAHAWDVIIVGTISAATASPQAEMVEALTALGRPIVTVALRTPWDLAAYPRVGTHIATYSIHRESMDALAGALFGAAGPTAEAFPGRLPVRLDLPGRGPKAGRPVAVPA